MPLLNIQINYVILNGVTYTIVTFRNLPSSLKTGDLSGLFSSWPGEATVDQIYESSFPFSKLVQATHGSLIYVVRHQEMHRLINSCCEACLYFSHSRFQTSLMRDVISGGGRANLTARSTAGYSFQESFSSSGS